MVKRFFKLFCLLLLLPLASYATHNRSGEITYEAIAPLSYRATIITYTKTASTPADRDTLKLKWGDGTTESILRSNGPTNGVGIPQGEELTPVSVFGGIKKNIYISDVHTYTGSLPFFIISMEDKNRIDEILNINRGASISVPFYVEDTIRIFDVNFLGLNSSPILFYPPIDFANVNDSFFHNPAAFDPDGDSLHFSFVVPLETRDSEVPNFQDVWEISPSREDTMTINPLTGELIWATPKIEGIYNVAILITEYRGGIKMGTMIRDLEIIVLDESNNRPEITEFADTCVVAGTLLEQIVTARDQNPVQSVSLRAEGAPLQLPVSPAVFTYPPPIGNPVSGLFQWATQCEHIRRQFYEVVFRAQDSEPRFLVDLKTWLIKVVAPPPENLIATATRESITLNWDITYPCDESNSDFIGFSIWKRIGSNLFDVDTCQTGGLGSQGYTRIVRDFSAFNFTDDDVVRGNLYCYRILAEYAKVSAAGVIYNEVLSVPSNEACVSLKRDLPIIKNVSIEKTDSSEGIVFISWYNPLEDDVETGRYQPNYFYTLLGADGFFGNNLTNRFVTQPSSSIISQDTTYLDSLVNTIIQPYSYQIDFYSNDGDTLVGSTEVASSVYLSLERGSTELDLTWEEHVPWVNYRYDIYRAQDTITNTYVFIDSVNEPRFLDRGLRNDTTYCYYIKAIGHYTDSSLVGDTLINFSQRVCDKPVDTVAPCAPVVRVVNYCRCEICEGTELSNIDFTNCPPIADECTETIEITQRENALEVCIWGEDDEIFKNELSWTVDSTCDEDIKYYQIFYQAPGEEEKLIDTTSSTTYIHTIELLERKSLAAIYCVKGVDKGGLIGECTPVVVKNCACYFLPNVFTPNADGSNDLFTPFKDNATGQFLYRFVESVDMKVYNQWGALVYETKDPDILWDGRNLTSDKHLNEGVYYYVCKVFIKDGESTLLSGYIHLIRGNGGTN